MKIFIKCNDRVFARMLSLELEERGYETAERAEDADALIINADESHALPPIPTLFFGRGECPFPEAHFLRRPFLMGEFFAELERLFPQEKQSATAEDSAVDTEKEPQIKLFDQKVIAGKKTIALSKTEYLLFSLLFENRGRVFSREEISRTLFPDVCEGSNACDVYVHYLREKIEKPLGIRLICTKRGKGYFID